MNRLLFVLCVSLKISLFSQAEFSAKDIDIISIDTTDNDVYFYKRINSNTFKEIEFVIDKDNPKLNIKIDDEKITKDDVFYEGYLTFSINDLQKTSPKTFLKKRRGFRLKDGYSDEYKIVSSINNHVLAVNSMYFGKKIFGRGEGAISTHLPEDEEEKWRSNYADFFEIVAVKLKNKKYMYLLFDRYFNLDGYVVPYKNTLYFSYDNEEFIELLQVETSIYFNYDKSIESFDVTNFYQLKKKKQKYQLQSSLKAPVIKQSYDTILYNQFYIIGRNKSKVDVYDFKLNKLKIPHLKSAYVKERWLEVLTKDEAKYIDKNLSTIIKIPRKIYTVCGTVSSTEIMIKNDSIYNNSYYLEHSKGYFEDRDINHIKLKNIRQTDSITFLDGDYKHYTDDNDMYIGNVLVNNDLFRVKRKDKYGLFEINYDTLKFNISRKRRVYNDFLLEPEDETVSIAEANLDQLLPFEFDNIYFDYKSALICVEKDNKKGFLYNCNPILFDEFEKVTGSFFRVKKNGKKGFVDVKQNKEYY